MLVFVLAIYSISGIPAKRIPQAFAGHAFPSGEFRICNIDSSTMPPDQGARVGENSGVAATSQLRDPLCP